MSTRAKRSRTPLTDAYIASGDWNALWDRVRALDPEFIEAYLAFREASQRKGPLPPKFRELILVAVNVATTHLYAPGARRHMANALRLGATAEELLQTIQLTTLLGIHSVNLGVPILCEELERAGHAVPAAPASSPRAAVESASKRPTRGKANAAARRPSGAAR
jgi:alkylhydroperoxidase/carboxymuconolactone decarboxylase family protein YurZ